MALKLFNKGQKKSINTEMLPTHIAVIMDGNGRWAKQRMMPRLMGHREGVEVLRKIIIHASNLGVRHITFYAFSTENWKRPKEEVNGLMDLLVAYIRSEVQELHRNHVKLDFIGDLDGLPEQPKREVYDAMQYTKDNKGLNVHIAVNYGSRDELVHAIKAISKEVLDQELTIDDITKECVSQHLYTKGLPDPDLLIRTSGEERLSNFLMWQLAYSELFFTDILWPEFTTETFDQAIISYQSRHRRFGGI